jgi:hypothetical protein
MAAEALSITGTANVLGDERDHELQTMRAVLGWDPERFAREQIRGLVQQVFSVNASRPVRQVIFSAVEPKTDVHAICMRVGESLAMQTLASVAVVAEGPQVVSDHRFVMNGWSESRGTRLRQRAVRLRSNLWQLNAVDRGEELSDGLALSRYLGEVRSEFEYSVIQAPPASLSTEAIAMSQFADGIILVLAAQQTRRAIAFKIKQMIHDAHGSLLGTILSDREFPMPEGIYRRL